MTVVIWTFEAVCACVEVNVRRWHLSKCIWLESTWQWICWLQLCCNWAFWANWRRWVTSFHNQNTISGKTALERSDVWSFFKKQPDVKKVECTLWKKSLALHGEPAICVTTLSSTVLHYATHRHKEATWKGNITQSNLKFFLPSLSLVLLLIMHRGFSAWCSLFLEVSRGIKK